MEALVSVPRQDLPRPSASDKGMEVLDLVPDPRPGTAEEVITARRTRAIRRLVVELPPSEREVIVASFGLFGHPELSLRQVAKRFGYSKTGAWRVRERALNRLRARMGPAEEWL